MLYYAHSTKGFYNSEINTVIPADAVPINAEDHAVLLAGQAAGKVITAERGQKPVLADPEPEAEIDVRKLADDALVASDRVILEFLESGLAVPDEWRKYRDDLRSIIAGTGGNILPKEPKKSGELFLRRS